MSVYNIIIKSHPELHNKSVDQKVTLNNEQLYAIAIMSTALFGDSRDQYFEIRDKALRTQNIDQLIKQSNAIVLQGEAANDLDPEPGMKWSQSIANQANLYGMVNAPTKPYTIKIEGYYNFYLVQFDNNDFYKALWLFPEWIGSKGCKFLKYLYMGDKALPIDVCQ